MKDKIVIIILIIAFVAGIIKFNVFAANTVSYDVDFNQAADGIVKVLLNSGVTAKHKLVIQKGETKYIYNVSNKSEYESFPLQLGDGYYSVKLYENTTGTKYKNVYSEASTIDIKDEKAVYLVSNQQIKWNKDDVAIKLAQKLLDSALTKKKASQKNKSDVKLTEAEIISTLYNYVVQNVDYDYDKIDTLSYDYIPDIDVVLEDASGICFDYSCLLAAMLRSRGIPTKLIKGYSTTTDVYHAWNEVYSSSEKRWIIVDTTYDAYMYDHQKKYTMEKSSKNYTKEYEF